MRKKRLNKVLLLAATLLLLLQGRAQTGFQYKAALDTVARQGFYQITILPALAARLQPGLEDIRIADTAGRQVPYIVKTDTIYTLLPMPRLLHKDSGDKYSYVFLRFDDAYFIDRIELQVSGVKFYKRNLEAYTGSTGSAQVAGQCTLRPDKPAVFDIGVKTDHLLLKIQNDDNPPLHISLLAALQRNKCLFTYLEKGKQYYLLFGDASANAPVYDLQYFKDSIGSPVTVLGYGRAVINKPDKQPAPAPPSKNNRALVWVALGAASVILLLLTAKMSREINKRNDA